MSQSRPTDARIKELAEKKAQLDAQIAALNARRRLSQKKDEDRLKWLLGTLVFDRLSAEPALQSPELLELVRRDLPDRLTQRDRDRGIWQLLFPDSDEDRS
ncbi:mobilization protein [Roseibium sp.]|uniref:mobilization protein n=1 Tax=Roseibium sp. TaxID=1936156 RepID=UPI00329A40F2